MTFWLIAALIGIAAALFIAWPLLRERSAIRNYGLTLIVLIPVAALILYQWSSIP